MAKIPDGKKRILYVEDHQDTAASVAMLLSDHEVVVAGNKAEGLKRAAGEYFDLYIFDYDLPDGTGIELCLFVRTKDDTTLIVLCTASPALTEQEAIAVGAQRFIRKGDEFIDSLEVVASQFLSAVSPADTVCFGVIDEHHFDAFRESDNHYSVFLILFQAARSNFTQPRCRAPQTSCW